VSCRSARTVRAARGSVFVLCAQHEVDSRLPKYPRLPVLQCSGYARAEAST
jgi:hypothetical protein